MRSGPSDCPTICRKAKNISAHRKRPAPSQTRELVDSLAKRPDVALPRRFFVARRIEGIAELIVRELREQRAYPTRVFDGDAAHGFLFLHLAPVVGRVKDCEHSEFVRARVVVELDRPVVLDAHDEPGREEALKVVLRPLPAKPARFAERRAQIGYDVLRLRSPTAGGAHVENPVILFARVIVVEQDHEHFQPAQLARLFERILVPVPLRPALNTLPPRLETRPARRLPFHKFPTAREATKAVNARLFEVVCLLNEVADRPDETRRNGFSL